MIITFKVPSFGNYTCYIHRYWKHCYQSFSVSLFRSSAIFIFTSSTIWKWVPFNELLIFGNRKKSQEARSGEYGRCWNIEILFSVKKRWIENALRARALHGEKPYHFFHRSNCFFQTRSLNLIPLCNNIDWLSIH